MPIWGQILALSQLKVEQKLTEMMNYIFNLHFGEKFVKIRPKIGKLQMFIHILIQIFRVHVMQHVKLQTDNLVLKSCSIRQIKYIEF